MMRSMFAAVSGLKTHQTKMDVIGNNIANVNTVAFKSSSVTFQDILYQTTAGASAANVANNTGGVNPKQIGLGVTFGATNLSITTSGAAETTGRAFDIRLSDSSTTNFFVVNNGSENLFTRSGSFYVDGAGNLCMTSTGYMVMGWQVNPDTGNIVKDTVSPLRVMRTENLTSPAEATTNAVTGGILDKNDPDVKSDAGLIKNLSFYDKQGYQYTARFAIKATDQDGRFTVALESILDQDGNTIISEETATTDELSALFGKPVQKQDTYALSDKFQLDGGKLYLKSDAAKANALIPVVDPQSGVTTGYRDNTANVVYNLADVYGVSLDMQDRIYRGKATVAGNGTANLVVTNNTVSHELQFSPADGSFVGINGVGSNEVSLNLATSGLPISANGNFENILIDFSTSKNSNNGGKSTLVMTSGGLDGTTGKGKKMGALIGLSVDNNGRIFGTYDNGNNTILGQMAVAQFANASGLEKVGDNCYATTLNSGEFDGIGVEVTADGSKMSSGELEMSNVDLSAEFTQMITTQRGFQANSRVITTSDTLLEELVNLKR